MLSIVFAVRSPRSAGRGLIHPDTRTAHETQLTVARILNGQSRSSAGRGLLRGRSGIRRGRQEHRSLPTGATGRRTLRQRRATRPRRVKRAFRTAGGDLRRSVTCAAVTLQARFARSVSRPLTGAAACHSPLIASAESDKGVHRATYASRAGGSPRKRCGTRRLGSRKMPRRPATGRASLNGRAARCDDGKPERYFSGLWSGFRGELPTRLAQP
jgi:hypothetical protein